MLAPGNRGRGSRFLLGTQKRTCGTGLGLALVVVDWACDILGVKAGAAREGGINHHRGERGSMLQSALGAVVQACNACSRQRHSLAISWGSAVGEKVPVMKNGPQQKFCLMVKEQLPAFLLSGSFGTAAAILNSHKATDVFIPAGHRHPCMSCSCRILPSTFSQLCAPPPSFESTRVCVCVCVQVCVYTGLGGFYSNIRLRQRLMPNALVFTKRRVD